MKTYYKSVKTVFQTCPHCKTQTAHQLIKVIYDMEPLLTWLTLIGSAGLFLPICLAMLEYSGQIHCTQCDSLRRNVSFWSMGPY